MFPGNPFFDIDKSVFYNVFALDERVLQNEWHSFCMSLDLVKQVALLSHNGNLIVDYEFEITHNDIDALKRLMYSGSIAHHIGAMADIQIFSRALSLEESKSWTACGALVNILFISYRKCIFS